MKANELMIGDWVKLKTDDGTFIKVHISALSFEFIWGIIDDDEANDAIGYDYLEPIPLTAEILKRNCKNILRWKGKGYEWTWYNEDDGYIELSSRAEGETCKDGFFVSANGGEYQLFTIHYVHELQHALRLCGIEKEIEL